MYKFINISEPCALSSFYGHRCLIKDFIFLFFHSIVVETANTTRKGSWGLGVLGSWGLGVLGSSGLRVFGSSGLRVFGSSGLRVLGSWGLGVMEFSSVQASLSKARPGRGGFLKFTDEVRFEIGKYAALHGPMSAVKNSNTHIQNSRKVPSENSVASTF